MESEENEKIYAIFKVITTSLIYIIIGFFVIFTFCISKVKAITFTYNNNDTSAYELANLKPILRGSFRGCTSTTSCTSTTPGSVLTDYGKLRNSNNVANDTKGMMYYVMPSDITIGVRYYSANALYCSPSMGTPTMYVWTGNASNGPLTIADNLVQTYKGMDNIVFDLDGEHFANCNMMYTIFKANQAGAVVGFQIRSSTTTSSTYHYLVGYNITEITPSDYATATSIANAISSINSHTDSKIDTKSQVIMDYIQSQQEQTRQAMEEQTNRQIESQQVCTYIDKTNVILENSRLASNGTTSTDNGWGITDYINIIGGKIERLTNAEGYDPAYSRLCFYNTNKENISCLTPSTTGEITIPNNATYVRFTIRIAQNKPTYNICKNGNQAMSEQNEEIAKNQKETNDLIKSGDIDTSDIDNTLDIDEEDHGLTAVITAPLNAISGILSDTCTDLVVPIPFINENLTLPCFTPIYENNFPTILTIWQTVITGLVAYWICTSIFGMVHGFTDPTEDRIEVLDL